MSRIKTGERWRRRIKVQFRHIYKGRCEGLKQKGKKTVRGNEGWLLWLELTEKRGRGMRRD
jgi:hypothetical protein